MEALIALAFTYIPKVLDGIKLLGKVPEAAQTVKDLTAYVQSTVAHLKQAKLTPEQEVELDKWIDSLPDEDYWKPETP